MKGNFIYVFDNEAKEKLLSRGYKLIRSDEKSVVYVFENRDTLTFTEQEIQFVLSDVLTF